MSKAVIKKVKNTSQSGTFGKSKVIPAKKIDDAELAVEAGLGTAAGTPAVVAKKTKDDVALEKAIADMDAGVDCSYTAPDESFGFGCATIGGEDSFLAEAHGERTEPELRVGGKDIPLVKLTDDDIYQGNYNNCFYMGSSNGGIHGYRSASSFEEITVGRGLWKAEVNGVKVILGAGTIIVVDELLNENRWTYAPKSTRESVLLAICSEVLVKELTVKGRCELVNATLDSKEHFTLDSSSLFVSRARFKFGTMKRSTLTDCGMHGVDMNIQETTMSKANLGSSGNIRLSNVTCHSGTFDLNTSSVMGLPVDIEIQNTSLVPFRFNYYNLGKATVEAYNENHYSNAAVKIHRRIDYGYFSGIEPIPFVRMSDDDILVAGKLFRAEDFMDTSRPQKDEEDDNPYPRKAYQNGFGGGRTYGRTSPGSEMFRRVEQTLGNNERTRKPGAVNKVVEDVVNGVCEQISSRVKLFVTAALLK